MPQLIRYGASSSFAAAVIINDIGRTVCELLHTTHLFQEIVRTQPARFLVMVASEKSLGFDCARDGVCSSPGLQQNPWCAAPSKSLPLALASQSAR